MAHGTQVTFHPSRASQRIGMAVAVALHAVAGTALLTYEPARSALLAVAPIMVSLVTPPRQETKQPEPPTPPKPKPVVKPQPKPPEPLPIITAPVEAPSPSPIVVPPPPPPPPEPAPVVVAPPAPVVVTAPIFAADYLDN